MPKRKPAKKPVRKITAKSKCPKFDSFQNAVGDIADAINVVRDKICEQAGFLNAIGFTSEMSRILLHLGSVSRDFEPLFDEAIDRLDWEPENREKLNRND